MKKIAIIITIFILSVVTVFGIAYFTKSQTKPNEIKNASQKIENNQESIENKQTSQINSTETSNNSPETTQIEKNQEQVSSYSNDNTNFTQNNDQQISADEVDCAHPDETHVLSCAQKYLEEQNRKDAERIAQQDAEYCEENVPKQLEIYSKKILAENSSYKSQVEAYVQSQRAKGAPGSENAHREIAQKTYGQLHYQNLQFIRQEFESAARGASNCNPYAYGDLPSE